MRFDDLESEAASEEREHVGPHIKRPLGRVVDSFALVAAGASAVGSLVTSLLFNAAGAADMGLGLVFLTSLGVGAAVFLVVLLGGRHQDRNLP